MFARRMFIFFVTNKNLNVFHWFKKKEMSKFFSSVCEVDEDSTQELRKHLNLLQKNNSENHIQKLKSVSENSVHQKQTKFIKSVTYGQYLFSNFSSVGKKLILKIDHLSNFGLQVMDLNTLKISDTLLFEEEIEEINKIKISKDENYVFVFGKNSNYVIEMKEIEEYLKNGKWIRSSPLELDNLNYDFGEEDLSPGNPNQALSNLDSWKKKLNLQCNVSRVVRSSDGNCICLVVDQMILIFALPFNKIVASIEFRTIDILDLALFSNYLYLITHNDIEKFQLRIPNFDLNFGMKNLEKNVDLKFNFI
jgi:hypothetical protein